jgi:hypothetical protein
MMPHNRTPKEFNMSQDRFRHSARMFILVMLVSTTEAPLAHAQKLLPDAGKDLASQIAASVSKEQKKRIAVLPVVSRR